MVHPDKKEPLRCSGSCGKIYLLGGPVAGGGGGQIGVDKAVQIAVHDVVDVAGFKGGAGVLDHLVGHEDVGADLAAPLDLQLNALQVGDLLGAIV